MTTHTHLPPARCDYDDDDDDGDDSAASEGREAIPERCAGAPHRDAVPHPSQGPPAFP